MHSHRISISRKSWLDGFTLIEVMVVVIIISIAAAVTLFSIDVTGYQKARTLAKQIKLTMRHTSDEAILTGVPHALELQQKARQIVPLNYRNGAWSRTNAIAALSWDNSIVLNLVVDGVTITEDADKSDSDDEEQESEKPYILFWSTGLWEPAGGLKMVVDGFDYLMLEWTSSGKMKKKPLQNDEEL